MSNIVPERIRNFAVYINGSDESGIADGDFPNIEYMTSEVKGAGLAGAAETITVGHFGSITCTLNWRYTPKKFFELAEPRVHDLDLYGDLQALDSGLGQIVTRRLHLYIRAQTKSYNFGKMAVADSMESTTEHEILYIKVEFDGKEVLEIDKFNYIYKVNGVDYLQESRRALGKM